MPLARLIGNAGLSFLTKFSSGYWSIFDPTNGFTAVHAAALRRINFSDIDDRFFFETDMLISLGSARAVVVDIPMEAKYGSEISNLKIGGAFFGFLANHLKKSVRRIFYHYFLRDFSIASLNLILGIPMFLFGLFFGGSAWIHSVETGTPASAGTVILAALPILPGVQMLLSFLNYDMASEPKTPLQTLAVPRSTGRHDT